MEFAAGDTTVYFLVGYDSHHGLMSEDPAFAETVVFGVKRDAKRMDTCRAVDIFEFLRWYVSWMNHFWYWKL